MTNENMRKKIAIAAARSYDDWVEEDYAKCIQKIDFDKLADALIAAGIGDMSDIRSLADNVMLSVIVHKAEVSSMEQRAKEAEHRAEVAERALLRACKVNTIFAEPDVPNILAERVLYEFYIRQAEKELEEEK